MDEYAHPCTAQKQDTITIVVYLHGTRQKARDVHKGHNRDVERVQETYKSGGLDGRIHVQASCQVAGVVGHNLILRMKIEYVQRRLSEGAEVQRTKLGELCQNVLSTKFRATQHSIRHNIFLNKTSLISQNTPTQITRIRSTYADGASLHARKATNDVFGVVGHDLGDHTFIHYLLHHLQHVVRYVGIIRHLETIKTTNQRDAVKKT